MIKIKLSKEISDRELAYEHFIDEVLNNEIINEYENAKAQFEQVRDTYGFDISFEKFIGEVL